MTTSLDVGGRAVPVSTLDRVLWPDGTTKADLLDYYLAVAPSLLPELARRPVTLHRFPEGVEGRHFYQTRVPPHPDWVRTETLTYPRTGKTFEAPVIDDLASLVWAVNLAAVEFHPFLFQDHDLEHTDLLVVDLDPGAPAGRREACLIALRVRERMTSAGLTARAKTSGGKGVHVTAAMPPGTSFETTKAWCRELARERTREDPEGVTDQMDRRKRQGKVFLDWSQNDAGKSTVAAWSVRGFRRSPTVAMPVDWTVTEDVVSTGDERALVVTLTAAREVASRQATA
ncbi:MAG: non-homologous end-joining DNA ligase [Actinomycetales bacterium]